MYNHPAVVAVVAHGFVGLVAVTHCRAGIGSAVIAAADNRPVVSHPAAGYH